MFGCLNFECLQRTPGGSTLHFSLRAISRAVARALESVCRRLDRAAQVSTDKAECCKSLWSRDEHSRDVRQHCARAGGIFRAVAQVDHGLSWRIRLIVQEAHKSA
jgi:hypothetical protein